MREDQENPFQPPIAPLQDVASAAKNSLYRITGVGIAALIAGPLSGTWLISQNLKRIGQSRGQRGCWTIGIILNLLYYILASQLVDYTSAHPFLPVLSLNIAGAFVMHYCAREYFGAALDKHAAAGGSLHSNWRAAGVGLLVSLLVSLLEFVLWFIISVGLLLYWPDYEFTFQIQDRMDFTS